jgi:hypothetical protein
MLRGTHNGKPSLGEQPRSIGRRLTALVRTRQEIAVRRTSAAPASGSRFLHDGHRTNLVMVDGRNCPSTRCEWRRRRSRGSGLLPFPVEF